VGGRSRRGITLNAFWEAVLQEASRNLTPDVGFLWRTGLLAFELGSSGRGVDLIAGFFLFPRSALTAWISLR